MPHLSQENLSKRLVNTNTCNRSLFFAPKLREPRIVRRGSCYQVYYASNNPSDRERRPRACLDEAHLATLLHHCGTESAVMTQVCADVRHGKRAVVLVALSAEQLQT